MCLGCELLLKTTWHQKDQQGNYKQSVCGSASHKGPQRGLLLSAFIKNSHSLFLFWYLIENWAWGLPTIAIKMLNTPSCWHVPSSGTCTHECCWVSVDCLLLIHYVWFNADAPERWLLAWVRSLWAQSLGIWEREETVEWNGGVTTDTLQETFENLLALPILVRYLCSAMWTEKLSRGLLRASAKLSTEILLSC